MTLPASGTITLAQIQTEFGGSNPIGLNEYYRNGAYVTPNNTSVPTSGAITLSNFYGANNGFYFTISSNTQQATLSTLATAAGWNGINIIFATVANGVYLWSDSTSVAGLTVDVVGSYVTNSGYIMGKGGNGGNGGDYYTAGGAAGPALHASASGITITNNSGAFIAGGGGGGGGSGNAEGVGYANHGASGGGGAGGGNGGSCGQIGAGGVGGAIGQAGANGATRNNEPFLIAAIGGGSGGGGGMQWDYFEGAGAGGGRILAGTGGAGAYRDVVSPLGGAGGSAGSVGGAGRSIWVHAGGGGGGGWGANGGSGGRYSPAGGAGGAAISGTSVTLNNSGTVYGSVS
jgi:hypothetical protein